MSSNYKAWDSAYPTTAQGETMFGYAGERCYKSHKPLKIGNGVIVGGACSSPVDEGCDVYVALDAYGGFCPLPWNKEAIYVDFPIKDMHAPSNKKETIKLVQYLCNQLQKGKKVHVGCIGGHGRTGTIIAAVVKMLLGEEDAITWVRKNYCKKAVESSAQVDFLHSVFGIKKVEETKKFISHGTSGYVGKGEGASSYVGKGTSGYVGGSSNYLSVPVKSSRSIW